MRLAILVTITLTLCFKTNLYGQFVLYNAFPNINFVDPVGLQNSGDNTNRIFVIERAGRIKVFPNSPTVQSSKTFLDITDRVSAGNEMGLLGLVFHPDYGDSGYFYVNYTTSSPQTTRISRFKVSSTNPDSADKNSELILLSFNQPFSNHNGGWLGFGPNDGYLYIGVGDGGGSGDTQNNAQNLTNLLGSILRIDVDNQDAGLQYAIPPDNPFVDSTRNEAKEIYAWGLRNPWRSSFDPVTGWLWTGDVGQNIWEEIDIIENGKNYGWRCYEGNHNYNITGCDYPEYIFPIWEYSHGPGCSITGGYVYRGTNVPELMGKYIYSDYCSSTIWSLEYDGINPPNNQSLATAQGSVTSFGVDENEELFVITFSPNRIYTFTPTIPVELKLFSGTNLNGNVTLDWTTTTETNNYGFEVQKRTPHSPPLDKEGKQGGWEKIGFVEGNGTTTEEQHYLYKDMNIEAGRLQYRLKQIDFDGGFKYSNAIEVETNVPLIFALGQNYPNPFNPSTLIKYSVPERGFVKLSIYNLIGEEISVLVENEVTAGFHEVTFNSSNLPSGTYFYRFQFGIYVETKKMVLLK
jgi:glucose/arabinose dehydrogenase